MLHVNINKAFKDSCSIYVFSCSNSKKELDNIPIGNMKAGVKKDHAPIQKRTQRGVGDGHGGCRGREKSPLSSSEQ